MGTLEIIGGIILLVLSVGIVTAVSMQESKSGGMGVLSGDTSGSGSFFDKNRGKTKEAVLVRATSVMAVVFVVMTLAVLFVLK